MSPWEPGPHLLGNLGTLTTFTWKTWEPCREPWRNLEGTFWEPWGTLLGNLYLGTWEPLLGNLEPWLGNLGTLLGNLYLEPGNLGGMGFGAAPVCSQTFTMAEDPKAFCCWGKMKGPKTGPPEGTSHPKRVHFWVLLKIHLLCARVQNRALSILNLVPSWRLFDAPFKSFQARCWNHFFSVQRHMALVRSFIKPERQLHFANSPNWSRGNISHEDNVHTKENWLGSVHNPLAVTVQNQKSNKTNTQNQL